MAQVGDFFYYGVVVDVDDSIYFPTDDDKFITIFTNDSSAPKIYEFKLKLDAIDGSKYTFDIVDRFLDRRRTYNCEKLYTERGLTSIRQSLIIPKDPVVFDDCKYTLLLPWDKYIEKRFKPTLLQIRDSPIYVVAKVVQYATHRLYTVTYIGIEEENAKEECIRQQRDGEIYIVSQMYKSNAIYVCHDERFSEIDYGHDIVSYFLIDKLILHT